MRRECAVGYAESRAEVCLDFKGAAFAVRKEWRLRMPTCCRALIPILLVLLMLLTASAQTRSDAFEAYNRGNEHYLNGDFDRAVADFTRAIDLSSRPAIHRPVQNRNAGMGFAEDASESSSVVFVDRLTALALSNRALALFRKGDMEGALADCDRGIAMYPGMLLLYSNRAAIRWATGNLAGAISDYDQVIRKNPRDAQAYDSRGNCRIDKGDLDGALVDLDQAIRLSPRAEFYVHDRGLHRGWYSRDGDRTVVIKRHHYWDD